MARKLSAASWTRARSPCNYVQWESAEHLAAMQRSSDFQAITRRFAGLIEFDPHQYEVVHIHEAGP